MDKPIIIECSRMWTSQELEEERQRIKKEIAEGLVILQPGFKIVETNTALLEQIKAEIGRIETEDGGDFLERPATDIIYEAQKIIDKHISELKGEQE